MIASRSFGLDQSIFLNCLTGLLEGSVAQCISHMFLSVCFSLIYIHNLKFHWVDVIISIIPVINFL